MSSDLMRYLPDFLHDVEELKKILSTEDSEIDLLEPDIDEVFPEKLIMECSEERLSQWEQVLGVEPQGTVEERRYYIKGILNSDGKLNEDKIKDIVASYTGGEAIVTLTGSVIKIQVLPPPNGELYRFEDVERTIKPLKPAHLGLTVERFYSTWGDIKKGFADWAAVKAMDDWQAVKEYIEE